MKRDEEMLFPLWAAWLVRAGNFPAGSLVAAMLFFGFGFAPMRAGAATPAFQTTREASVLVIGGAMMTGDHFGDASLPVMREHFAGRGRIALVLHATHPTERDVMEARLKKAFAHLLGEGVQAVSLHWFDDAGARDFLRGADGIFVGGGETFVLLAELHRTGQLALMRERVLAGVPYAGTSAGANVAGLLIGTTNDFPVADIPSRGALAIFPAVINPHHPAPEPKAEFEARAGKIRAYLKFNPSETVLALGNAASVRLHGGRIALMAGKAWIYRAAGVRELVTGEPVTEFGLGR